MAVPSSIESGRRRIAGYIHSPQHRFFRFLVLAGLFFCLPSTAAASTPASPLPPNILLVVADDLGWGALGAYGQQTAPPRTPAIDKLAAEGVRFTQFYAGSSVCAPSRCSLLTGRDTGTCGIRGNYAVPMAPDEPTIATRLKALGYRTAMIGKWALGGNDSPWAPRRKGFDYFFGFTDQGEAHNYYPEWVWENETPYRLPGNRARFRVAVDKVTYVNDVFVAKALAFLEENRNAPIFLYLPLTLPHENSELAVLTGNGMEVPQNHYADAAGLDPGEQAHASMIREIDNTVAALIAKLRDLGLEDRTLVLVTSDNGSAPYYDRNNRFDENGGLRGKKGTLYEGGIRVPLVVWGPGQAAVGRVVHRPVAAWDLLPTFLELAGAPAVNPHLPGVSLLPLLRGTPPPASSPRPLYWELHVPPLSQALRSGNWKLIRTGGANGTLALFDLASDPQERHDLAQQQPQAAAALAQRIDSLRTDDPQWPLERFKTSTAVVERRREGYAPGLPEGLSPAGVIRLVEVDPHGGSYYRSHLYYWSGGRVENQEIYRDLARAADKQEFLDGLLPALVQKHPADQFVFAMQATESLANREFRRFAQRHGWQLEGVHRYVERYSVLPDIELSALRRTAQKD